MISKSRLKQIKYLHTAKGRDELACFVVEGEKTVLELLQQQAKCVVALFALPDFLNQNATLLKSNALELTEVSEHELGQLSLQKTPNKVLAICNYFEQVELKDSQLTNVSVFLDEIRDPGNFGTLIRLCDWFGIKTLFCSKGTCDFYNPKVIQASMGAFMRVQIIYTDLNQLLAEKKFNKVYGAVLNGESMYEVKFEKGLLVIGNESNGISEENIALINTKVKIPAHGSSGTESLNAAMAASILVSEMYRQIGN
ncbi:MAG: RNA methyltransferase [Sphingobacteriaceae bacterium]|nr:RNA methyltransferase [Sphingobacteriaceae bacterium]